MTNESLLQSEDGSAGSPDFGEHIDATTFEQVGGSLNIMKIYVVLAMLTHDTTWFRSSRWTMMKKSVNSARVLSTTSSHRLRAPFRRWT